ncbi:MAG: hypothetical protein LBV43_07670 [Prevotella sp.]|jgi:hypothetical protein|nr:hypothetical protein [Prevotella sp.]
MYLQFIIFEIPEEPIFQVHWQVDNYPRNGQYRLRQAKKTRENIYVAPLLERIPVVQKRYSFFEPPFFINLARIFSAILANEYRETGTVSVSLLPMFIPCIFIFNLLS